MLGIAGMGLAGCGSARLEQQDEAVKAAWSAISREFQIRADLVPELVAGMDVVAETQAPLIERVLQARLRAAIPLTPALLDDARVFDEVRRAQEALGLALKELFAATDHDAALAANQDYRDLRVLWQGAEGRIEAARARYIAAVAAYNDSVSSFPTNLTAGMFDFEAKPEFAGNPESAGNKL